MTTPTPAPSPRSGDPDSPPLAARVAGSGSSTLVHLLELSARPEVISFAVGLPDPELFDVAGLRRCFDAALTGPGAGANLQYSATPGIRPLREAAAARLTDQGLPTSGEEILVTTGSQQALTLAALLLFDPGDVVLVEEPTYLVVSDVSDKVVYCGHRDPAVSLMRTIGECGGQATLFRRTTVEDEEL